jgi:hypothetical protein
MFRWPDAYVEGAYWLSMAMGSIHRTNYAATRRVNTLNLMQGRASPVTESPHVGVREQLVCSRTVA